MKRWAIMEKGGKWRGNEDSPWWVKDIDKADLFIAREDAMPYCEEGDKVVRVDVTVKEWKR
jgi:hypothetical protein